MFVLYTAVGRFEKRSDTSGRRYPVVILNNQEHMLDAPEMVAWSYLSWRILTMEQIERQYVRQLREAGYESDKSFEVCINRLIQRGLVVPGTGATHADALYDLMRDLYLTPTTCGLFVKILSFLKLSLVDRIPFRVATGIFKKETYTDDEKQVLHLSKQALLSTAELIKCVEHGVHDLSDDDKVLKALYDDEDTTCDNIGDIVSGFERKKPVLLAVANLYLRKQIIFQRV